MSALSKGSPLARHLVGRESVAGGVRFRDHRFDRVETNLLVDLVDGVGARRDTRVRQHLGGKPLLAVPRLGDLVRRKDAVQRLPLRHHVRDRVAVGDGELLLRVDELDGHPAGLLGAPAAQELEHDVFAADPRAQLSAEDDAALFREREVDVAGRPAEPERRRTDAEADRAVRAVRAAVRVGARDELTRQDETLLREVEVEDPVARRGVVGLFDRVQRAKSRPRRSALVRLFAREDEVVVGDRRLARKDRVTPVIWLNVWIANGAVPSDAGRRSRRPVASRRVPRARPCPRGAPRRSAPSWSGRAPFRGPAHDGRRRFRRASELAPTNREDAAAAPDLFLFGVSGTGS